MKAVISTTYDNKYLYYLPIVTYCWNKLGVGVICFMPKDYHGNDVMSFSRKIDLQREITKSQGLDLDVQYFEAPQHKEATYSQCSRLYGACLDLPEDEILVIGDVDMILFKTPPYNGGFTILGHDLVPKGQYPMCYVSATIKDWRDTLNLNEVSYQQALDRLLGEDECQDYRACRWSVDQEQLALNIDNNADFVSYCNRSNGQNQFAQNRIDRDDSFWEERLNLDVIDAHLWRPGYTEENFPKILKLLKYFYPNDDFKWLVDYTLKYRALL